MSTPTLEQTIAVLRGEHVEHEGLTLGWRVVYPDLRSSHGYRWPWPGQWAESDPGEREYTHGNPYQEFVGDGLSIALTWTGAAANGIPAHTGLIVGYQESDVLGRDTSQLRVRQALVFDVLDLSGLIRAGHLAGANLSGASLAGASLSRASLFRANLSGANLRGANLRGANLRGADLRRADLSRADLGGADLSRADLSWADLDGADLDGADLDGADLDGADLDGADLGEWERGPDGYAQRKQA